ncbi:hypothetical protein [Enterococcus sp. DIV0170]|uniref:hypothetical protein n=1 Tax=Enterococcus sp. DIV0170 TaxID=2774642 RepID=UPI003F242239
MEILSYFYFRNKGLNTELMGKCHEGYDIKIFDKSGKAKRVDVKFSAGNTRRSKDGGYLERIELQFNIVKRRKIERGKGKTTDYYLLAFYEEKNGKIGTNGYMVPYEKIRENVNTLTITRTRVPIWIKDYELNLKLLKQLGIYPAQKESAKN